jgi:hypothetical protein
MVEPQPASKPMPRQTLISVMSWHTPLGDLNGVTSWQAGGYRFQCNQDGRSQHNWRWPGMSGLPETLLPGSDAYLDLQERAAREDLRLMAEAGFDVALFDMLPWPAWHPDQPLTAKNVPLAQFTTFLRWLRAAEGQGIQVGLFPDVQNRSGDYPDGYTMNVAEWAASLSGALRLSADAAALWRVDGRPAVFHFGTSSTNGKQPDRQAPAPAGGWREILRRVRADGQDLYFFADIRPHESARQEWDQIADAVHCFHPAGPARYLAEMQPLLAQAHRVPYVWSTSISYYNRKVWTPPDFCRIHDTYTLALAAGARFVHAMTWNDFAEDTDIAPTAFKGRCLLDVYAYYNRWFKDGVEPVAWPEHVVLGYPRAIPATVTSPSVSWGTPEGQRRAHQPAATVLAANPDWGDWRQAPYQPTMIWWARLDRPRRLVIDGVGSVELPAGLSMGTVGAVTAGQIQAGFAGDAARISLPAVEAVSEERERGLQYRYHDLLHLDGRERR